MQRQDTASRGARLLQKRASLWVCAERAGERGRRGLRAQEVLSLQATD